MILALMHDASKTHLSNDNSTNEVVPLYDTRPSQSARVTSFRIMAYSGHSIQDDPEITASMREQ